MVKYLFMFMKYTYGMLNYPGKSIFLEHIHFSQVKTKKLFGENRKSLIETTEKITGNIGVLGIMQEKFLQSYQFRISYIYFKMIKVKID